MTKAADMNEFRFDQLTVGQQAAFEAVITTAMVDDFARISGDDSPLHMDAAFAKAAGHPDRVVHGLLSAALFSTLVGVHLPGKHALLHEVKASFHKPVYPGTALTVRGSISYLNEAFRQAEIKAEIRDAAGSKLVAALIKVGLSA
jgi:3-hydroxybutyryl-CoA dehydratase